MTIEIKRAGRRALLAACLAGALTGGAAQLALAADYHEAPILADLVKAGKLPAVSERLPEHPRVITPVEQPGEYGGTWRSGMVGGSDRNWLFRMAGYEPLIAWDRDWTGTLVPNLAEEYSGNADATEFTFKLRKGLKWSDGQPFTSDDIGFFVTDLATNKDLFPSPPDWLVVGDKVGTFEKVDDLTFKIKFSQPYGLFPQRLASVYGVQIDMMAKHYCSQFMPAYNKDKLDGLIAAAGVKSWSELFIKRCGLDTEANERWQNPDRPVMEPWVIKQPYSNGATIVTLERNPYYHKVDTAGNQLPYIDKLQVSVNADDQTLVLKAVNGEIDYQDRHINKNSNRAVFLDSAKTGDYRLVDEKNADMNTAIIALNLNSKDPVKHEVFNNKDFRIGLSYAIDRKAIIDSVYLGQGEPWQGGPRKESPYYNETLYSVYCLASVSTRPTPRRTRRASASGPTASASPSPCWSSRRSATSSTRHSWWASTGRRWASTPRCRPSTAPCSTTARTTTTRTLPSSKGRAAWPTRCSSRPSTSRSGTNRCSPSPGATGTPQPASRARSRRPRSRSRWTSTASSRASPTPTSRRR